MSDPFVRAAVESLNRQAEYLEKLRKERFSQLNQQIESKIMPHIKNASVKVMRSYDYCHFEITLSAEGGELGYFSPASVDDLRKDAARLADKAVEQYKIAKSCASRSLMNTGEKHNRIKALADLALTTPEHERTPEEKAIIKAAADEAYAARRYDYEDDYQDEV